MTFDFAVDAASAALEYSGDFGGVVMAEKVLDVVSFVLGQLCVAHCNLSCQERQYATAYWPLSVYESCTSNANPRPSEFMAR